MAAEVARLVAVMEAQLRGFTKGMEQAQRIADARFGAIEKRMRTTESAFGKFGTGIGSSFTRFLGTAAVIAFGKSVLDMASSLTEQAQQIGVSVEGLQAYRAALATANINQSETDTLLTRLTRNMGEAAGGSKNLRAAFAAVGISANELGGGPEAVLPKIATELLKIPDAGTRARIEFDLFGRSGQKLESALRILATPTADLIAKGKALGVVLGKDVADGADKAKDRIDDAFRQLRTSAAPAIVDVTEKIVKLIEALEKLQKTDPRILSALIGAAVGGRFLGAPGAVGGAVVGGFAGGGGFSDLATQGTRQDILTRETVAGGNSARLRALAQAAGVPFALSSVEASTDAAVNAAIAVADDLDAAEKMLREGEARLLSSFKLREPVEFELPATSNTLSNKDRVSEAINDAEDARQENQRRIDAADTRLAEETGARQIELADQLRGAFDITGAAGVMAFEDIGDAAQQALQQIAAMIFQLGVMEPILNGLFGKKGEGGGLLGPIIGAFTGTHIPARAGGGPVSAGSPYWIGERGRELFVPDKSGRIIPNTGLQAAGLLDRRTKDFLDFLSKSIAQASDIETGFQAQSASAPHQQLTLDGQAHDPSAMGAAAPSGHPPTDPFDWLTRAIRDFLGKSSPQAAGPPIPGRASGGPVQAGNPYWVGERGRELFIPKVPGVVVPRGGMGGSTHLNWTINVRGTGDKELISKMRAGAAQMLGEYDRNLPRRVQGIAADPYMHR